MYFIVVLKYFINGICFQEFEVQVRRTISVTHVHIFNEVEKLVKVPVQMGIYYKAEMSWNS